VKLRPINQPIKDGLENFLGIRLVANDRICHLQQPIPVCQVNVRDLPLDGIVLG
jgi:hypothetical protein